MALNLIGAGVLVAAAVLYVNTFGARLPPDIYRFIHADDAPPAVVDPPTPTWPSSGHGPVQGESGSVETPTASATPTGKVVNGREQPKPLDPPQSGEGTYRVVPGMQQPPDRSSGPVVTYIVEVERGLPFDGEEFAETVHSVLNDPRSWGHDGRMRFERVDHGSVRIRVALSSADLTDRMCSPLHTFGRVSCWNGVRAVINAERWGLGAETYGDDILSYREYVINHEVGHGLGHEHVDCPRPGALAPVMVQQTKNLGGCRPNPWPYPD
jgi:Protein of unknown function (DUF3152)